jgi:hypothetical protein
MSTETSTKIEIRHYISGALLAEGEGTIRDVLESAVTRGANLRGAYLDGAYLRGAYLDGAYLDGAYLDGAYLRGAYLDGAYLDGAYLDGAYLYDDTLLPEGVAFGVYCAEVLPWLLQAGGKPLESFRACGALECHDWTNCLMAHAFDAADLDDVPAPYRPWAERTIQLFDAHLLDGVLGKLIPGGEPEPVAA